MSLGPLDPLYWYSDELMVYHVPQSWLYLSSFGLDSPGNGSVFLLRHPQQCAGRQRRQRKSLSKCKFFWLWVRMKYTLFCFATHAFLVLFFRAATGHDFFSFGFCCCCRLCEPQCRRDQGIREKFHSNPFFACIYCISDGTGWHLYVYVVSVYCSLDKRHTTTGPFLFGVFRCLMAALCSLCLSCVVAHLWDT